MVYHFDVGNHIKKHIIVFFTFFTTFLSFLIPSEKKLDYWEKWFDEVNIIMTKAELSVFKALETEEDKKRFQQSFWKMRDPKPETPQNEYMIEFYNRRQYAESRLGGVNSDMGRIYILLGEPLEKSNFSGNEGVVDCELWTYKGEGRPGLPPFMYVLFFRQGDVGDYRLFYPGIHSSLDIVSPYSSSSMDSRLQAYRLIKIDFPELAQATLSVIPGEGDPALPTSASSSNYVFSQIFTLPEREVEKTYLKNFTSVKGIVDVTYSFREIAGKGNISISENKGLRFLNYSIMPDVIHTAKTADKLQTAKISLNLRVENLEGITIYQRERNIDLELDEIKKKDIEEKKAVFEDFLPIIEGEFNVSIAFSNKSTEEFFVYREKITIADEIPPVMVGFKVEEINSDNFMPFSTGTWKVLSDPRQIFNPNASLEGVIVSEEMPEIYLTDIEDERNSIEIKDIVAHKNYLVFRQSLSGIKAGNYYVIIKKENNEIYRKIISILSFDVKKPLVFLKSEPHSSELGYIYEIAQEYLNKRDVDSALENFNKLPENFWNSATCPVIARAYYMKKDYEKVVNLLEEKNVEKNYSVLLLLANSSLELKRLQKAAEYFELLRKYGDTAKINNALGAIYYSLGDKEKAKVYWDRAKNLEMKSNKKDS